MRTSRIRSQWCCGQSWGVVSAVLVDGISVWILTSARRWRRDRPRCPWLVNCRDPSPTYLSRFRRTEAGQVAIHSKSQAMFVVMKPIHLAPDGRTGDRQSKAGQRSISAGGGHRWLVQNSPGGDIGHHQSSARRLVPNGTEAGDGHRRRHKLGRQPLFECSASIDRPWHFREQLPADRGPVSCWIGRSGESRRASVIRFQRLRVPLARRNNRRSPGKWLRTCHSPGYPQAHP